MTFDLLPFFSQFFDCPSEAFKRLTCTASAILGGHFISSFSPNVSTNLDLSITVAFIFHCDPQVIDVGFDNKRDREEDSFLSGSTFTRDTFRNLSGRLRSFLGDLRLTLDDLRLILGHLRSKLVGWRLMSEDWCLILQESASLASTTQFSWVVGNRLEESLHI